MEKPVGMAYGLLLLWIAGCIAIPFYVERGSVSVYGGTQSAGLFVDAAGCWWSSATAAAR